MSATCHARCHVACRLKGVEFVHTRRNSHAANPTTPALDSITIVNPRSSGNASGAEATAPLSAAAGAFRQSTRVIESFHNGRNGHERLRIRSEAVLALTVSLTVGCQADVTPRTNPLSQISQKSRRNLKILSRLAHRAQKGTCCGRLRLSFSLCGR
jgi:hypothetical protein